MIKDLVDFKLDLERFANVIVPETHRGLMKVIAIRLYNDITDRTPRDTGWHRANWSVKLGYGKPLLDSKGRYPEEKRGMYQPMARDSYGDVVSEIVSSGTLKQQPFIWLYNNASGIEVLEDGHSAQAPTGMVAHALNNLQAFADTITI